MHPLWLDDDKAQLPPAALRRRVRLTVTIFSCLAIVFLIYLIIQRVQ